MIIIIFRERIILLSRILAIDEGKETNILLES